MYIFQTIFLILVAMFITTFRPLYAPSFFRWLECRTQPFISFTEEEGRSVLRPKRCDKHSDKDEDNSPKNVNNLRNIDRYYDIVVSNFEL